MLGVVPVAMDAEESSACRQLTLNVVLLPASSCAACWLVSSTRTKRTLPTPVTLRLIYLLYSFYLLYLFYSLYLLYLLFLFYLLYLLYLLFSFYLLYLLYLLSSFLYCTYSCKKLLRHALAKLTFV